MSKRRRKDVASADRILPGVWRLRLPLPWPGVPHVNVWAIAAGDGIVLVDTGHYEPGSQAQLERALDQAGGLRLEHVRLVVCTHAHADHYGLARPIMDAAGCELWMHPDHAHMTRPAEDPDAALDRRIEVARQSGVPVRTLEQYREQQRGSGLPIADIVLPDRELLAGVEISTDIGVWRVYETPGHAPSHVCLHQPERRLLLSGDHILGRVAPYFQFGFSDDPLGEFLASLEVVESLDVDLVLPGHGRPARDLPRLVRGNRRMIDAMLERALYALGEEPKTAFDLIPVLVGEQVTPVVMSWALLESLSCLRHLELTGRIEPELDSDPVRWKLASS